jgi:hypothetical protein
LREKLDATDRDLTRRSSLAPQLFTFLLAIAVIAGGLVWWLGRTEQQRDLDQAAKPTPPTAPTTAPADSAAMDSSASAAAADTAAPTAPLPATTGGDLAGKRGAPAGPPVAGKPVSAAHEALSARTPHVAGTFGIAVGTYMAEQRAIEERDRLQAATHLDGIVTPSAEGGTTLYRVILGRYSTRHQAELAAVTLMSNGLVRESLIVPLPQGG